MTETWQCLAESDDLRSDLAGVYDDTFITVTHHREGKERQRVTYIDKA